MLNKLWAAFALVLTVDALAYPVWQRDVNEGIKKGDGTSFNSTNFSFQLPIETWSEKNERITADFRFEQTSFEWQGTTAATQNYYWLAAPLRYTQWRGRDTELVLKLTPGLMTDLNVLSDAIWMDAEASARFYVGNTAYWQFGVTVNREFGDQNIYPIAAYAWKVNRNTEAKIGFPHSKIQTLWHSDLTTYAHIKPDGGMWVEEIEPAAAGGDAAGVSAAVEKIRYKNWVAGVGSEFRVREGIWIGAEVGYMFERNIQAVDEAGASMRATPENSLYWQIGLTFVLN